MLIIIIIVSINSIIIIITLIIFMIMMQADSPVNLAKVDATKEKKVSTLFFTMFSMVRKKSTGFPGGGEIQN